MITTDHLRKLTQALNSELLYHKVHELSFQATLAPRDKLFFAFFTLSIYWMICDFINMCLQSRDTFHYLIDLFQDC